MLHTKNNMTIKKVTSITKLEDLGHIRLSKAFFMRDSLESLSLEASLLTFKKGRLCHVINWVRGVPSPFLKERARERIFTLSSF
jgi:hypothetical protein